LGLSLGTTHPSVEDLFHFMNKIERRMMGPNRFISYHRRLILVNSLLSTLPIFYMCVLLKFLINFFIKWIFIESIYCLSNRGDVNRKGGCLVAWKKATRPKNQGELGIIDRTKYFSVDKVFT
jgi:hypothetical protein